MHQGFPLTFFDWNKSKQRLQPRSQVLFTTVGTRLRHHYTHQLSSAFVFLSDVPISAIEKLRDHDNQLMLFYVQDELDFHETSEVKTWYSVGLALNVDGRLLDRIQSQQSPSPMHKLIQYLKTKGEGEPSMRDLVNALLQCKRYDVAKNICNCPWPLTEAQLER